MFFLDASGSRRAMVQLMSEHSIAGRSHCQNCGAPLSGPYCSKCGQHDVDYHRSLWPILEDSLEGMLHVDSKFFRTVRCLFSRPGFLTNEFIAGRRTAYAQPIRLYVFASFLYFASGIFFHHYQSQAGAASTRVHTSQIQEGKKPDVAEGTNEAKPQSAAASSSAFQRAVERLNRQDRKEVAKEMAHLLPIMAFFCLPLLAAALFLAYFRSGRVYVEHMIFALHVQAFSFLAMLATDLTQAAVHLVSESLANVVGFLFFVGGAWLIYRAFRTVYGETRWRTIFKMALVSFAYGIILVIGMAVTAVAAAFLVLTA
jgi:hypothetical protein